ncbi:MAG TPA: carboxymuconolactone decarboxylase family protein, partial [bacterium]|nr:carboxymuconolactone decarboxylase family protein [bacterium]
FSVGLVVGGSIVIPHLRRAVEFLDEVERIETTEPHSHGH